MADPLLSDLQANERYLTEQIRLAHQSAQAAYDQHNTTAGALDTYIEGYLMGRRSVLRMQIDELQTVLVKEAVLKHEGVNS